MLPYSPVLQSQTRGAQLLAALQDPPERLFPLMTLPLAAICNPAPAMIGHVAHAKRLHTLDYHCESPCLGTPDI